MHLFYTPDIEGDIYTLNADESRHCVRVLRLGAGEAVSLVDGKGTWYEGVIERAEVRGCEIRITDRRELYGRRNFHLHLAVAPTKNIDRIEWMLEKCTEMGERNYQYYESGAREPNLETFVTISDVLEVSTDYLVGRSDVAERK